MLDICLASVVLVLTQPKARKRPFSYWLLGPISVIYFVFKMRRVCLGFKLNVSLIYFVCWLFFLIFNLSFSHRVTFTSWWSLSHDLNSRFDTLAPFSVLCLDCRQKLLASLSVVLPGCKWSLWQETEKGAQAVRLLEKQVSIRLVSRSLLHSVLWQSSYSLTSLWPSETGCIKDASVFQLHHKAPSLT